MAKLFIKNKQEPIELSNSTAKKIEAIWKDDSHSPDQKITAGNVTIPKKDIKAIFLDSEFQVIPNTNLEKYYKWRDAFIAMSPREKAEKSAWGHFSFFYYGVNKQKPNEEEWKEKVLDEAEKFYQENPMWSKPKCFVWWNMLQLPKETPMDNKVLTILERVEASELEDIRQSIDYEKAKKEIEEKQERVERVINEVTDEIPATHEITAEDLPF